MQRANVLLAMAGDLSFKAISKDDLDRLQGLADADEVKSVISEVLGHHGPTEREEVEADLVFYVLAFARARGFSDRKVRDGWETGRA